jgi:hypothetical protein
MGFEAFLVELFASFVTSLLGFEAMRADAPTVVKDAQHDQPLEDEFDKEVAADVAAGLVDKPAPV